jgi:Domain of unknown function (DUF4839)
MSIPPPGYKTPQASPPPPPPPAPQGAPLSQEHAKAQTGSRPAYDSGQYELKSVQALRGRESRAKAKWHNQGWELVSENPGTLRTELNFRRVKPKTFGAHLLSIVATFRRAQPKTQFVLVASCALLLVASIIGIVVGTQRGGNTPKPSAAQTPASTAPPAEPTEPDATKSSAPDDEQVLTADNSEEFAALLAVPDYCDETIAPFVAKYAGRTIKFDGSIANMANHGDYDTRYDILVYPGDKGPESTVGPAFKFEDVNVFDLNLTGAKSVGEGDRFRFVAQVDKYNPTQCLLFLAPASTRVR